MAETPPNQIGDDSYITAEEAAARLGVTLPTLYVYVGRKKLRSKPVQGSRKRLYLRADIDREVFRRTQGRAGTDVALGSAAVRITREGPHYAGRSAVELAETGTLEEAAALLWGVEEAQAFTDQAPKAPEGFDRLADLLRSRSSVERAAALLHMLETANPRAFDFTPTGLARTGADILRWLAAILFLQPRPSTTPIHLSVGEALGLSPPLIDLTRRLLVLAADHGLEASAEAVCAVAHTGVTPWRSITAGLLVSAGRRSGLWHFRAVQNLLDEVLAAADARDPIIRLLRQGEPVPGFGTPLYDGHDPRARALLASCRQLLPDDPELDQLGLAFEFMLEAGGWEPDFPLARALVSRKLGVDDSDPLFNLARSAGWISHSIERLQAASGGDELRALSASTSPSPTVHGARLS